MQFTHWNSRWLRQSVNNGLQSSRVSKKEEEGEKNCFVRGGVLLEAKNLEIPVVVGSYNQHPKNNSI